MWAIRRCSNPLRSQSCCILFNQTFYAKPGAASNLENGVQFSKGYLLGGACHIKNSISHWNFWPAFSLPSARNLSSHVENTSSDNEDDLEDRFSHLEMHTETDNIQELAAKGNDELFFEGDSIREDGDEVEDVFSLIGTETAGEKEPAKKIHSPKLFKVIMETPRTSFDNALDQWVRCNSLGQSEVSVVLQNLRKRRLFAKALQFMQWLEKSKCLDYAERDYATRLDLIAKIVSLNSAEQYVGKVPKSFRGEVLYRTLLANYVAAFNVQKAEEIFNKIRNLDTPTSTFTCNQLILLYKRINQRKIDDVLRIMKKEDIKPSSFTYRLLIDSKGMARDLSGMEDIIATMKEQGLKPDLITQAVIARNYIFTGKKTKANEILRDIEGDDITMSRFACVHLLPLYAYLKKSDHVGRIWKVCENNPTLEECSAAIAAWGKLGKVEEAEKVFEKMMKSRNRLPPKYYNVLLNVYANHKLLSKGLELANRISDDGCKVGPSTWDALVKLYVEAGEIEKADSILQKATEQSQVKPLFTTYIYVLEKYSERGDIHNAEKLFHGMKRIGYSGRMKQYQLLLQAYVNAKTPAYGFRDRMKADNIFPNKAALAQLQTVDAFRKTKISVLLS